MLQPNQVLVYDCTLRDGSQGENISLSVEDKLHIAQKLDEFGVPYVEGGWPGSNDKDVRFFERAKSHSWKHTKITAFGMTRHWKNPVDQDPNIAALLQAETPVVTLVGKSWDFHVLRALGIELDQNLQIVRESVGYLKSLGKEVVFDAEHFFDGFCAHPDYALAVLEAAHEAGADWLVPCDTNGGALPSAISRALELLVRRFPYVGIHTHNDSEMGVANTVAAVEAGARMVQGTMNGYGERCGNANLCSVMPILELKMGRVTVGPEKMKGLSDLAHYISETANVVLPNNLPFVGKSAFAHKGGLHVSGILRDSRTYEHLEPESVGNSRRVLVSDLSGKSNLRYKLEEFGDLELNKVNLDSLLDRLKKLEFEGYQFEGAEGSFKLLVHEHTGAALPMFHFQGFRVLLDREPDGSLISEATVKVTVDGIEEHTAADGNGPVHAIDRAIKKALTRFYPEIEAIRLIDYKVRVLDAKSGTAAKVRVLIESTDGHETWTTVGVSSNIIEASWKAIEDSIVYKLVFRKQTEGVVS
jgi:2-isopropylmalate synthase